MFALREIVVSTVNAQGLIAGQRYEVVDLKTRHTFVGGFTTYLLRACDLTIRREALIPVGNGHLVLRSAS